MAERKAFLLRVDPALLDALQRWADDELRSINERYAAAGDEVLDGRRLGCFLPHALPLGLTLRGLGRLEELGEGALTHARAASRH